MVSDPLVAAAAGTAATSAVIPSTATAFATLRMLVPEGVWLPGQCNERFSKWRRSMSMTCLKGRLDRPQSPCAARSERCSTMIAKEADGDHAHAQAGAEHRVVHGDEGPEQGDARRPCRSGGRC